VSLEPATLRSMTGFGAASLERDGVGMTAEVRSVNHRHLVVRVKGPSELAGLDIELEQRIKRRIARGSVTVFLRLERSEESTAASINGELLTRYAERLDSLAEELGRERVSLDRLLSLPGVVGGEDSSSEWEGVAKALALEAAEAAIDDLIVMREREGEAMAEDLKRNCARLAKLVSLVEGRMPELVGEHHASLQRRVEELMGGGRRVDEQDLAREMALLADRLDVSEEVSRLGSHLVQLVEQLTAERPALEGDGPTPGVGRKLDFLIQETLREVNTIGSKCNDATVAHWVVDMKNAVERLREQVQNIE